MGSISMQQRKYNISAHGRDDIAKLILPDFLMCEFFYFIFSKTEKNVINPPPPLNSSRQVGLSNDGCVLNIELVQLYVNHETIEITTVI